MGRLYTLLLLLNFACSPVISAYNDFDRDIDLPSYNTFNWGSITQPESGNSSLYNDLSDKRIKAAVSMALDRKGYKLTAKSPHLLVHYHIIIADKSVVTQGPSGHEFSPYWTGADINSYQYKEGTLIVDLMDAKTNALLWRGWAVGVIEEMRPKNIEKKLNKTVQRIFEGLPVALISNSNQEIDQLR